MSAAGESLVVFWWPRGHERRVVDLPRVHGSLLGEKGPRALRTRQGLLVHTAVAGPSDARRPCAHGARAFFPSNASLATWHEPRPAWRPKASHLPPASQRSEALNRPGRILLQTHDATEAWEAPGPDAWPPLVEALGWSPERLSPSPEITSSPLRLRLSEAPPIEHIAGCFARRGECPEFGLELSSLPSGDRRDLRLVAGDQHWILFSPRGLDERCPRAGRLLRDIGTPLEPVLIPADRTPLPNFHGAEIRRAFDAIDGTGMLWWDDMGEHVLRFGHRELTTPTDEALLDWSF